VERAEAELLAGRAQAIAKGWLLTLLERAPLDAVAAIPAAELACEGPAVCAALARALGSEAELDRLRPAGDLAPLVARIGALAGARDAAATLAAVDALRACLWAAALDARGARTDDIAPLAERLAEVALVAGATALAAFQGRSVEGEAAVAALPPAAEAGRAGGATAVEPAGARADRAGGGEDARPAAERPTGAHPEPTGPARGGAGPEPADPEPADPEPAEPAVHDLRPGSVTELPQRPAPPAAVVSAMDDADL
jgi:hypothetical protein